MDDGTSSNGSESAPAWRTDVVTTALAAIPQLERDVARKVEEHERVLEELKAVRQELRDAQQVAGIAAPGRTVRRARRAKTPRVAAGVEGHAA